METLPMRRYMHNHIVEKYKKLRRSAHNSRGWLDSRQPGRYKCAIAPWETPLLFDVSHSPPLKRQKDSEQRAKQPPDFPRERHVGICGQLHSSLTEPAAITLNRMSTHS